MTIIEHCFICRPSNLHSRVLEDDGIEHMHCWNICIGSQTLLKLDYTVYLDQLDNGYSQVHMCMIPVDTNIHLQEKAFYFSKVGLAIM